jgi:type IV pilus assembly protein PilQ
MNGGRGGPSVVLTTDEATNTFMAVGEPRVIAQIEGLLETLDVRQPQVMLEVVLVSLSDTQTRSLGVELAGLIKSGEVRVRLASLFGLSTIAGGLPGGGVGGAGGTASVLAPEDFAIVLRALETVNQGRSLSNPRVLVGNGQQATLNSTLGQPVTSVNASDTVATTSFAGFSDAGTQVSITPRIAAGDHLLLEYSITLSAFVGESPGAGIPPPRQQNQLQSVVSIPDGYTVVVGGIELATEGESENRVPLLGSIPVVREAFRSRNWNQNRQRFFVFIRAQVDRGRSFEGLRYESEGAMEEAGVEGWPVVQPRVVR